jgi:hypothetical protein
VNSGTNYEGKYFVLNEDIEYDPDNLTIDNDGDGIGDSNYTAIGNYNYGFKGHFDGQGHTISGIRIYSGTNSNYWYQGLFGRIYGEYAEVKNVTLADARIRKGGDWQVQGHVSSCSSRRAES